MRERPILFSAPMVRALLDGSKTQTRRIVKAAIAPSVSSIKLEILRKLGLGFMAQFKDELLWTPCPYGQPGDTLYVKETFIDTGCGSHHEGGKESRYEQFLTYVADGAKVNIPRTEAEFHTRLDTAIIRQRKYCPPEPKDEAAPDYWDRYDTYHNWLTNEFRRHRPSIFMPRWASRITLEIENVRVERLKSISHLDCLAEGLPVGNHRQRAYWNLWDEINGAGASDKNPWVWVITFRKL